MSILIWSDEMERLFNAEIYTPVFNDLRTVRKPKSLLGFPADVIPNEVLKMGRTDFNEPYTSEEYGDLSPDDKVALYCFFTMKTRLFEGCAAFQQFKKDLKPVLNGTPLSFVDLGCGPGTGGLALCEKLSIPSLEYIGFDSSKAMRLMAKKLLKSAIDFSVVPENAEIRTTKEIATLCKHAKTIDAPRNILLNASYLFSSDSLDVDDICLVVRAFVNSDHTENVFFSYTNSYKVAPGVKYNQFIDEMADEILDQTDLETVEIEYKKKRGQAPTKKSKYNRQLLTFKSSE